MTAKHIVLLAVRFTGAHGDTPPKPGDSRGRSMRDAACDESVQRRRVEAFYATPCLLRLDRNGFTRDGWV